MKKYYVLVGILLTAQLAFSAPDNTNAVSSAPSNPPANAGEDWTVNGKTFTNVKVTQVDPDRVHITYDGGLGTVNLSDLPPDLRKRFNYDPTAAKTVADQRQQAQDAEVAKAQQMAAAEAAKAKADADAKAYAAAMAQQQAQQQAAANARRPQVNITIQQTQNPYVDDPASDGSGH